MLFYWIKTPGSSIYLINIGNALKGKLEELPERFTVETIPNLNLILTDHRRNLVEGNLENVSVT